MKQKRILITGAGGFVGRALALGFRDLGWHVTGIDRAFDSEWEDRGISVIAAELSEGVPSDLPEVDLVVHAAWVTTAPESLGITRADYIALNLRPLLGALAFAARTRPAAFVFLSSSGVFAPTDGAVGLTDADIPTGRSPYAAAKRAGEILTPAGLDEDTAVHVVRLGYLFGPGEVSAPSRRGVSPVSAWLAAAREGRPLEVRADDPLREWTFTSDLGPALERLAVGPSAGQPVHVGSPHVWRDSAFAELIASEVPGAEVAPVAEAGGAAAQSPMKPPMVPSDVPALQDFDWTDPPAGLRVILDEEVAA